ncbi:hypothetical protein HH800_06880 [Sphingobium yanoikuyae]|uniref:Uncharacterized protein n=1 Tax=Sphingobium yanoikuyae TaxID=13690 RepID=A0A6M4G8F5_SPHYA|nr:hypothetical protein [Sphingobium yanoikuyae]QJR01947.1 hypothetical protein HH800_06880 [Sphingobium yanoikuyae]
MIDEYAINPFPGQFALAEYRLPGRIHAWLLDHLDSVTWDRDAKQPTLAFADDAIAAIFWLNFADDVFSARRVDQEKRDCDAAYQRHLAANQRLLAEIAQLNDALRKKVDEKLAARQEAGDEP